MRYKVISHRGTETQRFFATLAGLMTNKNRTIALVVIFTGFLMTVPVNRVKAGDTATAEKPTATLEMKYYKINGARKIHVKASDEDGNPVQNMIVNVYHR